MPFPANERLSSESPLLRNQPTPNRPETRDRARRIAKIVGLTAAIIAVGLSIHWGLSHTQQIRDQVRVWTYTSSAAVDGYIERSTMTDRARFLMLASHPEIQSPEQFEGACTSDHEDVGVLGCYVGLTQSIALLSVVNPDLDGIQEVVASHEMLHAAWDRMNESEKAPIVDLLHAEAAARAADPAFTDRMAAYAKLLPSEIDNELHSIIGTEEATISSGLETYYATFFTSRAQLVQLHLTSKAVFVDIENRSAALVAELDAIREGVATDYAAYTNGYDTLGVDVSTFNAQAGSGNMTRPAYDVARSRIVARQAALDALYSSIEARQATFDAKAAELEALNGEVTELNASINIVPRETGIG